MRLVLLDATYELFRAYFGAPPRTAPDGRQVGAVAGIAASTLALLREQAPLAIAAATDTVIHSFRNELYEGYKTDAGVPEDLLAQFPLAEDALEALGVTVWRMREFEADDGIASGAARFADEAERVILASPDKDLAQCVVGEHVVMLDRRRQITTDAEGVREKFGVGPESIPDYLALVGDAADGFPGLPGWGAKSAAAVLAHYVHLEAIPEAHGDWGVKGAGRGTAGADAARGARGGGPVQAAGDAAAGRAHRAVVRGPGVAGRPARALASAVRGAGAGRTALAPPPLAGLSSWGWDASPALPGAA